VCVCVCVCERERERETEREREHALAHACLCGIQPEFLSSVTKTFIVSTVQFLTQLAV